MNTNSAIRYYICIILLLITGVLLFFAIVKMKSNNDFEVQKTQVNEATQEIIEDKENLNQLLSLVNGVFDENIQLIWCPEEEIQLYNANVENITLQYDDKEIDNLREGLRDYPSICSIEKVDDCILFISYPLEEKFHTYREAIVFNPSGNVDDINYLFKYPSLSQSDYKKSIDKNGDKVWIYDNIINKRVIKSHQNDYNFWIVEETVEYSYFIKYM